MWPNGSQGRFNQFRPSILGSFWDTFWKTLGSKTVSKMKSVSGVLLGSKFDSKLMDFGTNFEPNEDDTLVEVLKWAKSIFEQQSMHFHGFQVSPKYIDPWFWKQTST